MKALAALTACILLAALLPSSAIAGLDYRFNPDENLRDRWKAPAEALKDFGTKLRLREEGGKLVLSSEERNAIAYLDGSEHSLGRVCLSGSLLKQDPVFLMARFNPANGDHCYLELLPKERRLELGRIAGGKREKLADGAAPASFDGRSFSLEMRFDGSKIVCGMNGELCFKAPDDSIQKGFAGARGNYWSRFEIAQVSVESLNEAAGKPLKAQPQPLAPETKSGEPVLDVKALRNWNVSKAFSKADGARLSVSLNQLWAFLPSDEAEAPDSVPKGVEWGYFMVPGHWRGGEVSNFMHLSDGSRAILWKGKEPAKYPSAWYRRTVNAPSSWKGRELRLLFENIQGRPTLFINGAKLVSSKLSNNSLFIDATQAIKAGEDNEIALFIDGATADKPRCGIFGDVWLKAYPGANMGEPSIECSWRRNELSLRAGKPVPEGWAISLKVFGQDGSCELAKDFKPSSDSLCKASWRPAKPWSPGNPNLYRAEIVLKDASGAAMDSVSRRFGFRELYVENGAFMLNGEPLMLKGDTGVEGYWTPDWMLRDDFIRRRLASGKLENLNFIYASSEAPDSFFDIADEMGVIAILKGKSPWHEVLDKGAAAWRESLDADLVQLASEPRMSGFHPSICGLLIDVWYNYHSGTTNPEFIGLKADAKDRYAFDAAGKLELRPGGDPNLKGLPAIRKGRLEEIAKLYGSHFPSLELFTGGSGEVGNVYATHIYHTWGAPAAEMRAFFERWKLRKEQPIFVGEMTIPYISSFYQIDNPHGGPALFIENGARLLGQKAYSYSGVSTLKPFHEGGPGSFFANTSESSAEGSYMFPPELYQQMLAKTFETTVPYWRADGLSGLAAFSYVFSGGFCFAAQPVAQKSFSLPANLSEPGWKPERLAWGNIVSPNFNAFGSSPDYRPLLPAYPVRSAFADVAAFIAGPASDFYLQDHAYYGGETASKSLVLMNGSASAVKMAGSLRLMDAATGAVIAENPLSVSAEPFKNSIAPIEVKLPKLQSRRDLILCAALERPGEEPLKSFFSLQAFPEEHAVVDAKLQVYDPEGTISDRLASLKIGYARIKSLDKVQDGGVLIVGRLALKGLGDQFDPGALVARGVNVLIMEQEPESSPELLKARQRNAFINDAAHQALAGFKDCDFADWRGSASAGSFYASSGANVNWSDWGARNMLATYVFRRPAHGSYVSLLASGFDLYQTPLLECRGERASWIACQLDMSSRIGSDPAATKLFLQLVGYLGARGQIKCRAAFFGDGAFAKFLDKFGVQAKRLNDLSSKSLAEADALLLADGDFSELVRQRDAIGSFVYNGGRIVYLQMGDKFNPAWLPFTMAVKMSKTSQAKAPEGGATQSGWGACELYFRDAFELPVFEGFPSQDSASSPALVMRHQFGNGSFTFTSALPERFGSSPAAGKASRLLSSLLVEQGVSIANASKPYSSQSGGVELDLSEQKWEFALDKSDVGVKDGIPNGSDAGLRWLKGLIADGVEVRVGQPFDVFVGKEYLGAAWYRLSVQIPEKLAQERSLYFIGGVIDDFDAIYVNGVKIGETGKDTPNWWEVRRVYQIPSGLLKPGENFIAIRVFNEKGGGGIVAGPVKISNSKPKDARAWITPYPGGAKRDYDYKPDIVRMY